MISDIEKNLINEIKLTSIQSKIFLLVTIHGKMSSQKISNSLMIEESLAKKTCAELIGLGAFIDISDSEFEAMHPRFTVVNMFRRMCERENIEFKRNKLVDSIGVLLEKPYDDVRTK